MLVSEKRNELFILSVFGVIFVSAFVREEKRSESVKRTIVMSLRCDAAPNEIPNRKLSQNCLEVNCERRKAEHTSESREERVGEAFRLLTT